MIAGMNGLAGTIRAKLIIGVIAVSCVGVVAYRVRGNTPQYAAIKMEQPLKASAKDKAEIIRLIDANAKSLAAITSGSGTTKTTTSGIRNLPNTVRKKVREYDYESTDNSMFSGRFHRGHATTRYIEADVDEAGPIPAGATRTTETSNNDEDSRVLHVESKSGYIYPAARNLRIVFGVYDDPATAAAHKKGESGIVGRESVDGDKCTVVEFRGKFKDGGKLISWTRVVWYNPSRGYAMVKERYWQSIGSGPKLLIREKEAKMYECARGIWLPARLEISIYGRDPRTGKQRLTGKIVSEPDSGYQVNIPIDKSRFTLEFPSGTKVQDFIKRTKYTAP